MTGTCNACGHEGNIHVDYNEDTKEYTPYCPICLSEDVACDGNISSQKGDES